MKLKNFRVVKKEKLGKVWYEVEEYSRKWFRRSWKIPRPRFFQISDFGFSYHLGKEFPTAALAELALSQEFMFFEKREQRKAEAKIVPNKSIIKTYE
jgi:hypothetical protein